MTKRQLVLLHRGRRSLQRLDEQIDPAALETEVIEPANGDQWCAAISMAGDAALWIAGVPDFTVTEEDVARIAQAVATRQSQGRRTTIVADREELLRFTLGECAQWSQDLVTHLRSAAPGLRECGDARTLMLDESKGEPHDRNDADVTTTVMSLRIVIDDHTATFPLASDRVLGPLLIDLLPPIAHLEPRVVASGDTARLIARLSRGEQAALAPGRDIEMVDARVTTLARSAHLDRGEPLGVGTTLLTGLNLTDFSDGGPDGRAITEMAEWQTRLDYLGCRQALRGRRLILLWPARQVAGQWQWVDARQGKRGFSSPDAPDSYRETAVDILRPYGHVVAVLRDDVLHWSGGAQGHGTLAVLLQELPVPVPQLHAGSTPLRESVRPRLTAASVQVCQSASVEVDVPVDPAYLTHLADLIGTRAPHAMLMGDEADLATDGDADEMEFGGPIDVLGGRFPEENLAQRRIKAYCEQTWVDGQPECMLIGDSIRMKIRDAGGYVWPAYRQLSPHVNLRHIPHNCSGTKVHLAYLPDWVSSGPDIVAINAGLHDLARNFRAPHQLPAYTDMGTYRVNCERILKILRDSGVRQVVWLLCTPVQEEWHRIAARTGLPRLSVRTNADIEAYNDVAATVMREWGVPVVDLYTPLRDSGVENVLEADGVHLNERGANLAGGIVAQAVVEAVTG